MRKTLKKGLLSICALSATLCASLSIGLTVSAEETEIVKKSIDEVSFTMVDGASIRADSFGIRFSALMSEADYQALDAYYDEKIEFGTFIMAGNYLQGVSKGTFEESHFFGDYDADETTSSLYTWEGAAITADRVEILQMDGKIYYDEEVQAMRVNGSVTSVYDHNLDMDYIGISYIKVGNEYRLATQGNNARSVVYVAQLAVEANKKADDVTAGNTVLDYYTTEVENAVTTVNYTVNTYLHDELNGVVKYDTKTVENAPLNETVDLTAIDGAIQESVNGYDYVVSRSTTSGIAYIGDKLVLDLYYHKKASGVLYDFYDKEEAEVDLYGNGSYAEIDGEATVKYVKTSGAWEEIKLPSEADEKFAITDVKNYYLKIYPLQVGASTELRFTSFTYSYNSTTETGSWSEKHHKLTANTWNYVTVSVGANTPSIHSIYYSIQKNSVEKGWVAIGQESGDALYIAEVGFLLTAEPTEKASGVILDFANYRDLEQLSSDHISYNYANKKATANGNGSLQLSVSGKWPEVKFGSGLASFDLTGVTYICMDVYVPTLTSGYVRIGINDSNYQKIYTQAEMVTIKIPCKITTLEGAKFNISRNDGSGWVNVGTVYIGTIYTI